MKKKRKVSKAFSGYIEGDDELRKQIFKQKPASQQLVFDLFSQLEHVYHEFFQFFCSIPSTGLWDLLTTRLSAVASGSDRNRNFCENYAAMSHVKEEDNEYTIKREKILDILGASHAIWFALSDPDYDEKPDTLALWRGFYDLAISRVVWEWWLESCHNKIKALYSIYRNDLTNPYAVSQIEDCMQETLGLLRPRQHWWVVMHRLLETYERINAIKNRISNPYLRLVYTITKSIAAKNQPEQFPDTYNIGVAGLMKSLVRYAPSIAMSFSSFAEREIRYEIYFQLSNYNVVALPHSSWQKYKKLEEMRTEHNHKYGTDLSLIEFVDILGCSEAFDICQQIAMQNPVSLDHAVYEDSTAANEVTLKDKLEDLQAKEVKDLLEDQEILASTLKRLPFRERKFFTIMYALCDLTHDDMAPDKDELEKFFIHRMN